MGGWLGNYDNDGDIMIYDYNKIFGGGRVKTMKQII